jgi:hypothetical protein
VIASVGAIFAAFYAAHMVADHWVQTQRQARDKGLPGWPGRRACAAHVCTYTATQALALLALEYSTGHLFGGWQTVAGLAVSGVTHYVADRRTPLRRLAELLDRGTGKTAFFNLGTPRPGRDDNPCLGTGAYALDQSWHIGWIFVSALVIA